MSLNHIEDLSIRRSIDSFSKVKTDGSFLPLIEKKTPKIQSTKSTSHLMNNDLGKEMISKNPEVSSIKVFNY